MFHRHASCDGFHRCRKIKPPARRGIAEDSTGTTAVKPLDSTRYCLLGVVGMFLCRRSFVK